LHSQPNSVNKMSIFAEKFKLMGNGFEENSFCESEPIGFKISMVAISL
jgi:hypothetical protein